MTQGLIVLHNREHIHSICLVYQKDNIAYKQVMNFLPIKLTNKLSTSLILKNTNPKRINTIDTFGMNHYNIL